MSQQVPRVAAERDIYDPRFVAGLFDEMAGTYGVTNYLASFGFTRRWRRQCVAAGGLAPGLFVVDLMTGMGECWGEIASAMRGQGRLLAIDLSTVMCERARQRLRDFGALAIDLRQEDALQSTAPTASADRIVAAFGLKTLSPLQLRVLAGEIARMLSAGGLASFVEIAAPPARWLRALFLFYLRRVIPVIGRLFLGNPDNYRMLGRYTEAFGDGAHVAEALRAAGLAVEQRTLFFGCAVAFVARKRQAPLSGP